ncbi:MAG: hypothetical protein QXI19_10910 [Candidatus Caldarchaeum sp.]
MSLRYYVEIVLDDERYVFPLEPTTFKTGNKGLIARGTINSSLGRFVMSLFLPLIRKDSKETPNMKDIKAFLSNSEKKKAK